MSNEKPVHAVGTRIVRADGTIDRKISTIIPESLAVKLRDFCHKFNREISDVVKEGLEQILEEDQ